MRLTLQFISLIVCLLLFLIIDLLLIICFNGFLIIIFYVPLVVYVFLFCVPIIIINWIFGLLLVCFDIESHRMYISRHVRFHEHVFPFDKSEQIAQVSTQTHTPSPITILPNLTHSPLFTTQNTPHPASASALPSPPTQTPQPPTSPCRSPHASLFHHTVASTGCSLVFPAFQHEVLDSSGTSSGSSSTSLYSASNPVSTDSASAASPPLAAASSPASSPGINLVVDLSAYPLH